MPVVQSSYDEVQRIGVEGARANMTPWSADTRICETAAGIPFGRACGQGAADKGVVLGGALTVFVGMSIRDATLDHSVADVDKYIETENVGVATRGDWWVRPTVDVVANDPVHYSTTTGEFTNTGGAGPIVGARYMTSAAAGELAVVRFSGALP